MPQPLPGKAKSEVSAIMNHLSESSPKFMSSKELLLS